MATTKNKEETIKFDAEIGKVLHLMIHSLYTNKDIFLRELVSNASDACDKLRYLALTKAELLKDDNDLKIIITSNEEDRTITITDNGVGMNKEDIIDNIGTIARSGTQKFFDKMTGDKTKDMQLIGQFGVGFYSSFIVAKEVVLRSHKAGEKTAFEWRSTGEGEYTIKEIEGKKLKRGTSVTLHLNEGEDDFLDKFRIKHIVSTYSDHISFPIEYIDEKGESESINSAAAIWMKPKSKITEEEHKEFYKHVSHSPDKPWATLHNKNEGAIEFTNLLYIPSIKPFDLFHPDRKCRVKLYVKRVYITDDGVELVPAYMRFLRGVIDSEDLPLNISRETLQNNHIINKISKAVIKKTLNELKNRLTKDREDYEVFWNNFGATLKEGLCEMIDHRDKIMEVSLFRSALQDKLITFDEYIENMKEGQDKIYYLSGDSPEKIMSSPQLEGFIKNGIDVLFFTDTVDDFWINVEPQYKDKDIKSITRSGIDLEDITNKKEVKKPSEEEDELTQNIINFFRTNLASKISDAKISKKLVDSPACLAVAEGAMDIRMERFLKDQKQLAAGSAKILEINLEHPIVKKLVGYINTKEEPLAIELAELLFDQACIIEGEPIDDTGAYSKRFNKFIEKAIL